MSAISTTLLIRDALLPAAVAGTISAATIFFLLRSGVANLVVDVPGQRSMHKAPTPRIGGLGIVLGAAIAISMTAAAHLWQLSLVASGYVVISLADDKWSLSVATRLPAHFVLAGCILFFYPSPLWLAPFVAVAIVWGCNLYNFMDGMDGLAGGMAVIGFAAYAMAAALADAADITALSFALAGGAAGFLAFNTHPAKIFMGDVGAISLGFLAGAVGYLGVYRGLWPAWFPFLVFAPFMADSTITLLRRMVTGQKFWEAHRNHYYQRMCARLGQVATVRRWYGVMGASAVSALLLLAAPMPVVALTLAAWTTFYGVAMICLDRSGLQ